MIGCSYGIVADGPARIASMVCRLCAALTPGIPPPMTMEPGAVSTLASTVMLSVSGIQFPSIYKRGLIRSSTANATSANPSDAIMIMIPGGITHHFQAGVKKTPRC